MSNTHNCLLCRIRSDELVSYEVPEMSDNFVSNSDTESNIQPQETPRQVPVNRAYTADNRNTMEEAMQEDDIVTISSEEENAAPTYPISIASDSTCANYPHSPSAEVIEPEVNQETCISSDDDMDGVVSEVESEQDSFIEFSLNRSSSDEEVQDDNDISMSDERSITSPDSTHIQFPDDGMNEVLEEMSDIHVINMESSNDVEDNIRPLSPRRISELESLWDSSFHVGGRTMENEISHEVEIESLDIEASVIGRVGTREIELESLWDTSFHVVGRTMESDISHDVEIESLDIETSVIRRVGTREVYLIDVKPVFGPTLWGEAATNNSEALRDNPEEDGHIEHLRNNYTASVLSKMNDQCQVYYQVFSLTQKDNSRCP